MISTLVTAGPSPPWEPFVVDEGLESFSYHLPHSKANALSDDQLSIWFESLHPSAYRGEPNGHAWTDASYKGQKLLRKTAWHTLDDGCSCEYGYSDTWQEKIKSGRMKGVLAAVTETVARMLPRGEELNCVNLNYYPSGGGVGWHADDEFLFDGLCRPTRIVSLTLCRSSGEGARRFQVRRRGSCDSDTVEVVLRHGDLMTMEGLFQRHYLHSVWPGDALDCQEHAACRGERINLTWRTIVRHLNGSEECKGMTCPRCNIKSTAL